MNIFFLDLDPQKAAEYHCDRHTIKLILESAQLLETAHIVHNSVTPYSTGKRGWSNHPCAKWVRASIDNYLWLCELGKALCAEYTYRYDKTHKYEDRFTWYEENWPDLPEKGFTTPYQAIGDELRAKGMDTVSAYREYYRTVKKDIVSWKKKRPMPQWMHQNSCT